ncbi:hypothetical protein Ancab_005973 [Ancistrocladus abbreviatus]
MVATRCNLLEAMEKERPVRDLNLHCLINHQDSFNDLLTRYSTEEKIPLLEYHRHLHGGDSFPDPTIEKHRSKCTVGRVLRAAKRHMQKGKLSSLFTGFSSFSQVGVVALPCPF